MAVIAKPAHVAARSGAEYLAAVGADERELAPSPQDGRLVNVAREGLERRRLAWDFLGSDLGGRGERYERFSLSDSFRVTGLAYRMADKTLPVWLVERFLSEAVE